jgi:hypothetical protein
MTEYAEGTPEWAEGRIHKVEGWQDAVIAFRRSGVAWSLVVVSDGTVVFDITSYRHTQPRLLRALVAAVESGEKL